MPYEYPEESSEQTPVESFNEITIDGYTYPTDEFGRAKDNEGNTTDPYGLLAYTAGLYEDDEAGGLDVTYCLDYLILEAHVALEMAVDSDCGGFLYGMHEYQLVRHDKAVEEARSMAQAATDLAYQWVGDNYAGDDLEGMLSKVESNTSDIVRDLELDLKRTPPPAMGYPDDEE